MNIITETRKNMENWFGRKQRKAYRRMQGDNYRGYVYQLTLPDTDMECTAIIRLTDLNMLDCATAVERLSAGLLPSDGSQKRDLRKHLEILSGRLLGNVSGNLPFGDDSYDEEERI